MKENKGPESELKEVVLDTTALIFLNDFSSFDEAYTVREVVEEVKDRLTKIKLSSILKELRVLEPNEKYVESIKEVAEETGDLEKLSKTDINVLALAKQEDCTIISDDYNIQNVAAQMKIKYLSIFNPPIKKMIKWKSKRKNRKV